MKRGTLFLAALLITASLAGCGKDKETEAQTQAPQVSTQATEKVTEKQTEPQTESSLDKTRTLNGLVTNSSTSSVEIQTVRGKKLSFSTEGAQLQVPDGVKAGAQVKIMYKGQIEGTDTSKAKVSAIGAADADAVKITEGPEVLQDAANPNVDGGDIAGTIKEITGDRMIILSDDGDAMYFTTADCKVTLGNGFKPGNYVHVKYTGDVYGPDIVPAVSVTDNTNNTAQTNATDKVSTITGTITEASVDSVVISTDAGQELTFTITGVPVTLNNGIATGQSITINYTGAISESDVSKVKVVALTDSGKASNADTKTDGTAADGGSADNGGTAVTESSLNETNANDANADNGNAAQ